MEYKAELILEVPDVKGIDFSNALFEKFVSFLDRQTVLCEEGKSVIQIKKIVVNKNASD